MKRINYRLLGRLPEEEPVELTVVGESKQLTRVKKKYKSVFPDIRFKVDEGDFKIPISREKRIALGNLMSAISSPLPKVIESLQNRPATACNTPAKAKAAPKRAKAKLPAPGNRRATRKTNY